MRKIITILLAITLILGMSLSVYASEDTNTGTQISGETTNITYDQYLKVIANEKGISIKEAKKIDQQENVVIEKKLAKKIAQLRIEGFFAINSLATTSGTYSYVSIQRNTTYPGNRSFSAGITATLKIYTYGSFRQICSVQGLSSRRVSGSYNCTWIQQYSWQDPLNNQMPCASVILGAMGYFECSTTVTGGISGGLTGFQVSATVGNTTYYQSHSLDMQTTYSVY